jgi:hypothetical protein
MRKTGASGRRICNFADCGSDCWVWRDGQQLAITCNRCHDRFCDPCQRERQAAIIEQIMLRIIDSPDSCRFVTLTLRHNDFPLETQIDRLIASFKQLRRRRDIAPKMLGGVWFLEVKLDKAGARWHPHLHIIVAGNFIDKRELARAWHEVTGDSFIVDIRTITDAKKQASYVAKYSTKPLDAGVLRHPDKLQAFMLAIKGRRL